MRSDRGFPIFQSHLDLAHSYWERLLQRGNWAIDATCGHGRDTLKLAQLLLHDPSSGIIAIDLQEKAIESTKTRLAQSLSVKQQDQVQFYQQSHETFPLLAYSKPIRLIIYNLGYLPKGNKQITTLTPITLKSIKAGASLLMRGGVLSVTCYPGHSEGAQEETALFKIFSELSSDEWNVCHHRFPNRHNAHTSPSFFLIQKKS